MTKYKKLAVLSGVFLFVLSFIAGCGGGDTPTPVAITVTFSPLPGTTDVAVDAPVTATFSSAITAEAEAALSTAFTLILDGTGLQLCTAVTYDAATLVATCTHADFGNSSNYTAAISSLSGVTDATTSFTTIASPVAITVTGFSKTSVTALADASGETTLAFTLSGALALGATPTLAMSGGTAGTCTVSADALPVVRCPVTGLAGCATFTDYTATLSGGMTEYSVTFNSADDEFTSGAVITNTCYATITNVDAGDIADGKLTVAATGAAARILKNVISGKPDLIAVSYLESFTSNAQADIFTSLVADTATENNTIHLASLNWIANLNPAQWFKMAEVDGTLDMATMDTTIWPPEAIVTQGLYFCFVHKSGLVNLYTSIDGATYTHLTADNMDCFGGACTLTDLSTSTWTGLRTGFSSTNLSAPGSSDVTSELSFTRFNSAPTDDGAADCAALTAY